MHLSSPWKLRPLLPEVRPESAMRVALCATVLVLGSGCVGLGTYTEATAERDVLVERVRLLEASTESLSNERVDLLEGLEDLREERTVLSRGVKTLTVKSEKLSKNLSAREAELAKQNTEVSRLRGTYDSLVMDLETELAAGQIQIQQLKEGLQVNVSNNILFASGSANLSAEGQQVLAKVAKELAELPHQIDIDGHTDNVAIRGSLTKRYPTNWELAGARAASVVRLFAEQGVEGERLAAISHAEFSPVASNETDEGRQLNRRIEIRLRPRGGAIEEPAASDEEPAGADDESAAAPEAVDASDSAAAAETEASAALVDAPAVETSAVAPTE
jgi:chemotaxis protein MotB